MDSAERVVRPLATGPLAGVRVLDFSRLAPGPFCSMLLGDLGADVVRVDWRGGPLVADEILSRNKRSIAIHLKSPGGRGVVHRLCEHFDVVLEGSRPGVSAKLGVDYATLAALNPRLVYCALTGFGQEGPLAGQAGHDINYLAVAGVLGQMGDGDGPPLPPLNLVADFGGGGLMAAFGIVCALYERHRSGRGQFLDAAMVDGAASLMALHYGTAGAFAAQGSGLLAGAAPFYRCYACKDGRYVAVGAIEPQFYVRLCEGLDISPPPEQMDPSRWPETAELFAARFRERTREQWVEHFAERDACLTPVLDLNEAQQHPHNLARGLFFRGPGEALQLAPTPRLSRTPGVVRSPAPELGAHTNEVLAECGFTDEEIEGLRESDAIG